jgi:anti-anti-sigma factor
MRAVVPLVGEVDVLNIGTVRDAVETAIGDGAAEVVFDLAAASFIDSSSLALFAQTSLRVGKVVVRDPPEVIRRVIEATGLINVLVVEP